MQSEDDAVHARGTYAHAAVQSKDEALHAHGLFAHAAVQNKDDACMFRKSRPMQRCRARMAPYMLIESMPMQQGKGVKGGKGQGKR